MLTGPIVMVELLVGLGFFYLGKELRRLSELSRQHEEKIKSLESYRLAHDFGFHECWRRLEPIEKTTKDLGKRIGSIEAKQWDVWGVLERDYLTREEIEQMNDGEIRRRLAEKVDGQQRQI